MEDNTMMYNNIDFDTYFKNYPDAKGYFGKYGGSYIPPELQTAIEKLVRHIRQFVSPDSLYVSLGVFVRNFRADLHRFLIWRDYQIRLEREFSFM